LEREKKKNEAKEKVIVVLTLPPSLFRGRGTRYLGGTKNIV
jgi:hypothetical protein